MSRAPINNVAREAALTILDKKKDKIVDDVVLCSPTLEALLPLQGKLQLIKELQKEFRQNQMIDDFNR